MTPPSRFTDQTTLDPAPTPARAIAAGRRMLLATFRRSGQVPTPARTVPVSDGRAGRWTADGRDTVKRRRRDPHVTMRACALNETRRS